MRMNAVLSNPKHPEYGQFTVPLPIPHNQYDGIMEALNAMDMGDPLARDCQMDEILGEYPILKRLEGKPVNIDELDYLAKRLDSFCYRSLKGSDHFAACVSQGIAASSVMKGYSAFSSRTISAAYMSTPIAIPEMKCWTPSCSINCTIQSRSFCFNAMHRSSFSLKRNGKF